MLKGKNVQKAAVLYEVLTGIKSKLHKMSYEELNILARHIGSAIYDMTPTWSGFKSQALLDQEKSNPKARKCPEHFYPRQVAGWRVIEHMLRYRGISKPKLFSLISVFIQVHYTTPEENTKLVPHQKYGAFISPEHSYQQAGINLVHVK